MHSSQIKLYWIDSFVFSERNNLRCIVRSHTEIRSGCTISHPGCHTVFSAPNKERGILGGVLVVAKGLQEDDLSIQGSVFTECDKEEAESLMHGSEMSSLLPLSASLQKLDMNKLEAGGNTSKEN